MRAARGLRLMLTLGSLTALAALAGCDRGSTARSPAPTATASATLEPRPSPVASLGAAPTDCAATPPPQTMTLPNDFGGGFIGQIAVDGGSPVWELGLGRDGVL